MGTWWYEGGKVNTSQVYEERYTQGSICRVGDASTGLQGWRRSLPGGQGKEGILELGEISPKELMWRENGPLGGCGKEGIRP